MPRGVREEPGPPVKYEAHCKGAEDGGARLCDFYREGTRVQIIGEAREHVRREGHEVWIEHATISRLTPVEYAAAGGAAKEGPDGGSDT